MAGGPGCVWFTSASGCLRQEGDGGAGRSNWAPRAAPCLAPSHACPLALPREEVVGVGGIPWLLWGATSGPSCKGHFWGWGVVHSGLGGGFSPLKVPLPAFLTSSLKPPSRGYYASRC